MPRGRRAASLALAACAISLAGARLEAQGALSTQGYGYPPGQLSTQSASVGGALGEFDQLSPINPAALTRWPSGGIYFQYDPEFRRVTSGGHVDRNTTARFPLVLAAVRLRDRLVVGVSTSTLLDRTWNTVVQSGERLGADSVTFTERFRSSGAINDIRLAGSYALSNRLSVGLGAHVLTGENRLSVSRTFPDTTQIGSLDVSSALSFTGTAFSGGVLWRPSRILGLAASGRIGGTLSVHSADTVVKRATAPARGGVAIRFDGLPGATFGASANFTRWSDLTELGTSQLRPRDGWDLGVGADVAGPHFFGTQLALRGGVRRRTLPFEAAGGEVRETAFTGGVGIPLAAGRAALDLGVQRAQRSSDVNVQERAWILSIGVSVRP